MQDPAKHRFVVSALSPGTAPRLDAFLAAQQGLLAPLSRHAAQRAIDAGQVTVDGRVRNRALRLGAGQVVELTEAPLAKSPLTPTPMALEILFEDEHLLVLNKPAHLSVHPGAGEVRPTLVSALLAKNSRWSGIGGVERPGIVHRLDRGTTGVMVVAKTDVVHRHLAQQFAARTVKKVYLALSLAVLPPSWARFGTIDTFYGRHPRERHRFTGRLKQSTRRAITNYRVLGESAHGTAIEVQLLTGRTHQARVHLAELGLPLAGDALYGQKSRPPLAVAKLALDHQALHAFALTFVHPVSEARETYCATPPAIWWDVAQRLIAPAQSPSG